jgi:hypothetical protein
VHHAIVTNATAIGFNKCRIVGEQDVNQVNENVNSELAPAGSAEIRAVLER